MSILKLEMYPNVLKLLADFLPADLDSNTLRSIMGLAGLKYCMDELMRHIGVMMCFGGRASASAVSRMPLKMASRSWTG